MLPTAQQQIAIEASGDARFVAVAGSGKTSTLVEYSLYRPDAKILYIAFNRPVRIEAIEKFRNKGADHVVIETVHSLAYGYMVKGRGLHVEHSTPKAADIIQRLQVSLEGVNELDTLRIASHIIRLTACFCNSDKATVAEINYLELFTSKKELTFLREYLPKITFYARVYLAKMQNGEIPISPDFYLKKFQLSKPQLGYDIILFDEAQDASPVMLDIILNQQNTIKVLVGDPHQQIYSWRYAINAMSQVPYPVYTLTTSFRFGAIIAETANTILSWKRLVGITVNEKVEGVGTKQDIKSRAILGRGNLSILVDAITKLIIKKSIKSIFFEGRFENYTISEQGSSLYDVLHLYNGRTSSIRDPLIASMLSLAELSEYAESSKDRTLALLIEVVEAFGNDLPDYLNMIKRAQVTDARKNEADIIYSTVHRCKGLEYDEVTLLDDFITAEKLQTIVEEGDQKNIQNAIEEINILYVAATRAVVKLNLPANLAEINPTLSFADINDSAKPETYLLPPLTSQTLIGRPWNEYEDNNLQWLLEQNLPIDVICKRLDRTQEEINARLNTPPTQTLEELLW